MMNFNMVCWPPYQEYKNPIVFHGQQRPNCETVVINFTVAPKIKLGALNTSYVDPLCKTFQGVTMPFGVLVNEMIKQWNIAYVL